MQREGSWSAYLQVQGWRKASGLLPHEEEEEHEEEEHEDEEGRENNRGQRMDLFVAWTPIDRLTLTLDVPFTHNRIEEIEGGASEVHSLTGLGDVAFSGSFVLWRNRPVLPSTWIEGRLFLKTPTGSTSRRRGGVVDPHLQAGTGSWDFGIGVAATHHFDRVSVYGSVFLRENTEGEFDATDYEYGDVVLANAAVELPIGHVFGLPSLRWLTVGTELNYRWAGVDKVERAGFRDSGGSILYVTPTTRIQLPWAVGSQPVSLRTAVQLPVTSKWLNGRQTEKEVWSVGVHIPFF